MTVCIYFKIIENYGHLIYVVSDPSRTLEKISNVSTESIILIDLFHYLNSIKRTNEVKI